MGRSSEKNCVCENLSFASKEAFKRLRTNALLVLSETGKSTGVVIGVTSSTPSEGKSLVSVNLAYSLAELGSRVLLIDSDMRRPTIHSKLEMNSAPGLSELIGGSNSVEKAIQRYNSSVNEVGFDVIPGGNGSDRPAELLSSERMVKLLDAVKNVYDYIILDFPPVGTVIDAVSVGKSIDGMVFVVRENYCPAEVFENSIRQLKFSDIKILGLVLNGSVEGASKKYKYSSKYYY